MFWFVDCTTTSSLLLSGCVFVWSVGAALLEAKFYVIGFEHMVEVVQPQGEVEYMPCEIGIVEWSMGKGISREFHRVINPGMLLHLSKTSNDNSDVSRVVTPLHFCWSCVSSQEFTNLITVGSLCIMSYQWM